MALPQPPDGRLVRCLLVEGLVDVMGHVHVADLYRERLTVAVKYEPAEERKSLVVSMSRSGKQPLLMHMVVLISPTGQGENVADSVSGAVPLHCEGAPFGLLAFDH